MPKHQIKAHLTGGTSSLSIDGQDISAAVAKNGLKIEMTDGMPVVTLRPMFHTSIELDVDGELVITPRSAFTPDEVAQAIATLREQGVSDEAIAGDALFGTLTLAVASHITATRAGEVAAEGITRFGLSEVQD